MYIGAGRDVWSGLGNGFQLIHIIEIVSAKPNRGRGELVRIRQ